MTNEARDTPVAFPGLLGELAAMPTERASQPTPQGHPTPWRSLALTATGPDELPTLQPATARWAKVIDQSRCIGCHACTTACKSENQVPLGVTRTYVKSVDVGVFPQARRDFQVTRCNQCSDEDHSAEKCNFCVHRIDQGLEPACVVVCPVEAILVGDLNDPTSKVAQIVNRQAVSVRRPEKETRPNLYYKGAHQTTLDPLAARRPEGDTYMWSQKATGHQLVTSGHPGKWNSSAAALLSYDVAHHAEWRDDGSLPGARQMFVADRPAHLAELPRDERLWAVCTSGRRAALAASLLDRAGIRAGLVSQGGSVGWIERFERLAARAET